MNNQLNILCIGDLGSGVNLVKNLILLDHKTHWPLIEDRFSTILNQYHDKLILSDWLPQEYKLRFWKKFYGIDLADNLDWDLYQKSNINLDLPIVFINHTAFYQKNEFFKFKNAIDFILVVPVTEQGLHWQIRAFCEKNNGAQFLHDFSFEDKSDIAKFIKNHGQEAYTRLNVTNMKHIIWDRQKIFREQIDTGATLPLEDLLLKNTDSVTQKLNQKFNLKIDNNQADIIIKKWRSKHWPWEDTMAWEYSDCLI